MFNTLLRWFIAIKTLIRGIPSLLFLPMLFGGHGRWFVWRDYYGNWAWSNIIQTFEIGLMVVLILAAIMLILNKYVKLSAYLFIIGSVISLSKGLKLLYYYPHDRPLMFWVYFMVEIMVLLAALKLARLQKQV